MDNGNNNINLIATAIDFIPTEDNTTASFAIDPARFGFDPDTSDEDAPPILPTPSTLVNNNAAAAVVSSTTAGKRGPVYTAIEELMVCKAFIATSEDAIVGTSQKGKHFKNKMFNIYDLFLTEQEKRDNSRLSSRSVAVVSHVYDRRSPDAIYDRWKLVSHKCSKLHGCENTTVMESGWDATKFDAAVDYHLEQKWPKLGATADIRLCYDYLKGKPKWNAFMESQISGNEKHSRPNGKKKRKH
jgi:hypothetical protein